jgi:hypothetical protein
VGASARPGRLALGPKRPKKGNNRRVVRTRDLTLERHRSNESRRLAANSSGLHQASSTLAAFVSRVLTANRGDNPSRVIIRCPSSARRLIHACESEHIDLRAVSLPLQPSTAAAAPWITDLLRASKGALCHEHKQTGEVLACDRADKYLQPMNRLSS